MDWYNEEKVKEYEKLRLGEIRTMLNGMKAKIIEYRGCKHITIQFLEDGFIVEDREYADFVKGTIGHPNYPNIKLPNPAKVNERIGQEFIASNGLKFTITDYITNYDSSLETEDGIKIEHKRFDLVAKGNIKHPYLHPINKSKFQNFKCQRIRDLEGYLYRCECQKCKEMFIMTPQMMIQHNKNCL